MCWIVKTHPSAHKHRYLALCINGGDALAHVAVAQQDVGARRHDVAEFSRAGWAVVCLGEDSKLRAALYGTVWAPLPQSSQAAEFVACAAAHQIATDKAQVISDCLNVVREYRADRYPLQSIAKVYASILKDTRMHAQNACNIEGSSRQMIT